MIASYSLSNQMRYRGMDWMNNYTVIGIPSETDYGCECFSSEEQSHSQPQEHSLKDVASRQLHRLKKLSNTELSPLHKALPLVQGDVESE